MKAFALQRRPDTMLPIANNWYEIEHIGNGISRILESHVVPWMRCNMWLIQGRDQDLLIDSGMGLKPLKAEIARLREKPVTAVCSHCHFDHIGCSHEFATRLGHRSEASVYVSPDLDNTCAREWIAGELLTALPSEGFSLSQYRITPAPLTGFLDDGDVVDVGDRTFNVLHLPGHSPGSIGLYEKSTRTLFSGDVIYDGLLIDNSWHSDRQVYRESLRRLRELPVETVHAGHEPSFGRDRLVQLIDSYLSGVARITDVSSSLNQRATS
jgi:glyoxylase-like metal-dependent hydrolase (beta-lactamase superfamily II)